MGFCFYKPIIDNQAGTYRTDGLVTSASMLSNVNQMYMGDQLVYPYVPFSSSGIVAWWRGDQNVVSSSATLYWSSYYSNTTSSFTLTGSGVAGSDYNFTYPPATAITGSKHKAIYQAGGAYVYSDLNNIFTTSSDITIVMSGRLSRGTSTPFSFKSWFGMTGDWDSYMGSSAQSTGTNYVLKRDEDVTPTVWFAQGAATPGITTLSYNGSTGDYSYYQNLGVGGIISGSRAGASGRLGSTQQLRIGGWDGSLFRDFTAWDIIVLNYIPSTIELNTWSAFCINNYEQVYLT
jgi:hypothetical protein